MIVRLVIIPNQSRLPFNLSLSKTFQVFELIYSDVRGPFSISIDNGTTTAVKGKGKIKIALSDILYVPSFPFQLLLVQKLTTSLNCDVIFTPFRGGFQDHYTK